MLLRPQAEPRKGAASAAQSATRAKGAAAASVPSAPAPSTESEQPPSASAQAPTGTVRALYRRIAVATVASFPFVASGALALPPGSASDSTVSVSLPASCGASAAAPSASAVAATTAASTVSTTELSQSAQFSAAPAGFPSHQGHTRVSADLLLTQR